MRDDPGYVVPLVRKGTAGKPEYRRHGDDLGGKAGDMPGA